MSAPLETFLARLYTDAGARAEFLADPAASAARAGLSAREIAAVSRIDRAGLELAARSFDVKREAQQQRARGGPLARWARWLRGRR